MVDAALASTLLLLLLHVATTSAATFLPLQRRLPTTHNVEQLETLRARDCARHSHLHHQHAVNGVVDFPIAGTYNPYSVGLYYATIRLGSPPKEYDVQIDTGSDLTWLICSSCTDCPQTSGLGIVLSSYDSRSSTTTGMISCSDPICRRIQTSPTECSTSNQCSYTFHYGDGSATSGYYVTDTLYFDMFMGNQSSTGNASAPIVFGCSTYQSGDLATTTIATNGILGLGHGALSVVSQLTYQGVTPGVFSHCLSGDRNGGGTLVLGEILEPGIVYTPLVPSQPHYNVHLQSISVNGQLLPIDPIAFSASSGGGTIIDSGTTLALLIAEAYDPFVNTVTSIVSHSVTPFMSGSLQCYRVSKSLAEVFPVVSLNFATGASMLLRPEEYLLPHFKFDSIPTWCIGFEKVHGGMTILGDLVLKDKIIVYDLVHQRLGWTRYNCSLAVNVSLIINDDEYPNAGHRSESLLTTRSRILILVLVLMVID